MISPVRRTADLDALVGPTGERAVALDDADPGTAIRGHAPDGVDRIVEVGFSDNIDLDARVARNGAVITAYATRDPQPRFDFWPMLFENLTIRLLGSDDFPDEAKQHAAADLTAAASDGALTVAMADPVELAAAAAHTTRSIATTAPRGAGHPGLTAPWRRIRRDHPTRLIRRNLGALGRRQPGVAESRRLRFVTGAIRHGVVTSPTR